MFLIRVIIFSSHGMSRRFTLSVPLKDIISASKCNLSENAGDLQRPSGNGGH